jgi:hypothetical protein
MLSCLFWNGKKVANRLAYLQSGGTQMRLLHKLCSITIDITPIDI